MVAEVSPTILAGEPHEFREQMERVAMFAKRVQIDLMDGVFAPTKSVELEKVWWPQTIKADIHLMYQRPDEQLGLLVKLLPHMVIIHAEADVDHMHFAAELHRYGILAGLSVLKETSIEWVDRLLPSFDHLLIFSGDLGRFGGEADMSLLDKVKTVKNHYSNIEIGWDGGVNVDNIAKLVNGGVDVLNVGGAIQKASNPKEVYDRMKALVISEDKE